VSKGVAMQKRTNNVKHEEKQKEGKKTQCEA
jgi:hypothetical protein